MITRLTYEDINYKTFIEDIVSIHKNVLDWSVLSVLGTDFLRFYYRNVLKNKYFFCNVYEFKGKIVGFLTFSTNSDGILSDIIKNNFFSFFFTVFKSVLKDPRRLKHILASAYFVLFQQKKILPEVKAEIIALAVLPEYRINVNAAQELFKATILKFDRLKVRNVKALVVKDKLDSNKFYSKQGQLTDISFQLFGLNMCVYNLYVKDILKKIHKIKTNY